MHFHYLMIKYPYHIEGGISMNDASLIKDLCEKQIESALEETLLHSECYLAAQKEVEKEMADLFQLNLNTKQLSAIDRVITASNEFGTEYGRVAYHQGFQDGVKLIAEIIDIASEPSDTKNQKKE